MISQPALAKYHCIARINKILLRPALGRCVVLHGNRSEVDGRLHVARAVSVVYLIAYYYSTCPRVYSLLLVRFTLLARLVSFNIGTKGKGPAARTKQFRLCNWFLLILRIWCD